MSSEEERERVAVYMDGLSQMRSDWAGQAKVEARSEQRKTKRKVKPKTEKE